MNIYYIVEYIFLPMIEIEGFKWVSVEWRSEDEFLLWIAALDLHSSKIREKSHFLRIYYELIIESSAKKIRENFCENSTCRVNYLMRLNSAEYLFLK